MNRSCWRQCCRLFGVLEPYITLQYHFPSVFTHAFTAYTFLRCSSGSPCSGFNYQPVSASPGGQRTGLSANKVFLSKKTQLFDKDPIGLNVFSWFPNNHGKYYGDETVLLETETLWQDDWPKGLVQYSICSLWNPISRGIDSLRMLKTRHEFNHQQLTQEATTTRRCRLLVSWFKKKTLEM